MKSHFMDLNNLTHVDIEFVIKLVKRVSQYYFITKRPAETRIYFSIEKGVLLSEKENEFFFNIFNYSSFSLMSSRPSSSRISLSNHLKKEEKKIYVSNEKTINLDIFDYHLYSRDWLIFKNNNKGFYSDFIISHHFSIDENFIKLIRGVLSLNVEELTNELKIDTNIPPELMVLPSAKIDISKINI